jgi:hypothetical protein
MITDEDGAKCSAKEMAQEILVRCMEENQKWIEDNPDRLLKMTARELAALNDQVEKLFLRAMRVMGIKPGDIILNNDPAHPDFAEDTGGQDA